MAIIELNGLTKYYGKNCGVDDVTFSVEEGEIFGFIGPNGAGKSTAILTLLDQVKNVPFDDILIGKPSHEEVFIHYYEKGDLKS